MARVDPTGGKRRAVEIVADSVQFLGTGMVGRAPRAHE